MKYEERDGETNHTDIGDIGVCGGRCKRCTGDGHGKSDGWESIV